MAIPQMKRWLAALVISLITSNAAIAQDFQPFGPAGVDVDWEWFAPAEQGSFGEPPDPNEGIFFTYERLDWNVTNPPPSDVSFEGQWTWGNRFEFGYMQDDRGWLVSVYRFKDLNISNRENSGFVVPNWHSSFGSGEVMRTFRLDELHGGSYLEPMVGVRYFQFDQTVTADITQNLFAYNLCDNRMVGPQVGARWFRQRQRWLLSAEGRFMAGINRQNHTDFDTTQFVPLTEVRVGVTYEIFKYAALTVGYTGTFLGNGVGQAGIFQDAPSTSSSHLYMNGINFGFVMNR